MVEATMFSVRVLETVQIHGLQWPHELMELSFECKPHSPDH